MGRFCAGADAGGHVVAALDGSQQRHRVENRIQARDVEAPRELVELHAGRTRLVDLAREQERPEQQRQQLEARLAPPGVPQAHRQRPGELQRAGDRAARHVEFDDVDGRRKGLPLAGREREVERAAIGGARLRIVSRARPQGTVDDRAVCQQPRGPCRLLEPARSRQGPAGVVKVVERSSARSWSSA